MAALAPTLAASSVTIVADALVIAFVTDAPRFSGGRLQTFCYWRMLHTHVHLRICTDLIKQINWLKMSAEPL